MTEVEKIINNSAFKHITMLEFQEMAKNGILSQLQVSFQKFQTHTHKLILTNKFVFLTPLQLFRNEQLQRKVYVARLQFQLKFQIQSAFQNAPKSQKIGISFYVNEQKKNTFYSFHEDAIKLFRYNISKLINQRGFHSLFVPSKKLGKGNFATVYEVIRVEDGRRFAVKAYSKESIYNAEDGKEGLINQLKVLRQATKITKNVMSLQQVYQTNNSLYAITELIEGRSLAEVMPSRHNGLSYYEARVFLKGILDGIRILHLNKIMHRDLKPENILFRTENLSSPQNFDPVITDFGMATRYDIHPYVFFRCGTPGFVAPQVTVKLENKPYSPICDQFSVGCLFYYVMTGQLLFGSGPFKQTLQLNKNLQYYLRTDRINRHHPYALNLLMQLLQADPNKRLSAQMALQHEYFGDLKLTFYNIAVTENRIQAKKQENIIECKKKQQVINQVKTQHETIRPHYLGVSNIVKKQISSSSAPPDFNSYEKKTDLQTSMQFDNSQVKFRQNRQNKRSNRSTQKAIKKLSINS